MAVNNLIFKDAEKAKAAILESQQKEITQLYESWADEIAKKAQYYSTKTNSSAIVSEMQMKQLKTQLLNQSTVLSEQIENKVKSNIYLVSDAVVKSNNAWLASLGFDEKDLAVAFSSVNNSTIEKLVTGQIYDSGWSLSKRIWGDNQQNMKDIYAVVAGGQAQNKSIYEIAKDLEKYVRPSAAKPWNLKAADGKKIYPKQVDYNSQRLARTLVQHGYQQSFIETTKDNPFIEDYVWRSNGSRVCELCKARDGQHYKKNSLPMDHPNGMCTMEPSVADDMTDQLAEWFNSPDGTYPEIDAFAENFGYKADKAGTLESFLNKYGTSTKSPNAWFNSLTQVQKAEAKLLKDQSGLTWNKWYEQNIYSGDGANLVKKAKVANKADDAIALAKSKLDDLSSKSYSGIWKEDVTPADYLSKQSKIKSKVKYYQEQIAKYSGDAYSNSPWASDEIVKMQKLLADLADFEKQGKLFVKAQDELLAAYNKINGTSGRFAQSEYIDEMKAIAKKFEYRQDADGYYRVDLDKTWSKLSEKEKYSVWEYTHNSNPMNKSLSGYHDTWSRASGFKGLGNTELGYEDRWRGFKTKTFEEKFATDGHVDYKMTVENLTNAINKSTLKDSVYLVRGSDSEGLAGLLEGNLISFKDALNLLDESEDAINAVLRGQTFTNHAFTSTGISSDAGFSGNVKYKIFAPKGTNAIYAEPASYYGNTISESEKLYEVGQSYSSVGGEAEIIVQRGTQYRITNISKSGYNTIEVEMEIVNQPDYFKTGLEHTHNNGLTTYKK